jgi:hypothetical protein
MVSFAAQDKKHHLRWEDLMNNVKVTILFYLVVASLVLMFCSSSDNKELVGEYVYFSYCFEKVNGSMGFIHGYDSEDLKLVLLPDGNYVFKRSKLREPAHIIPAMPLENVDENESSERVPSENNENEKDDDKKIIPAAEEKWGGKYSVRGNKITFTNFHQEERDISTWEFTMKTEEAEEDTVLIILPKKYVLDGVSKDVSEDFGYIFEKL